MRATQSFFLAVENDAAVPAGAASMLAAVQDKSMLQSISAVLDMMVGLIHGLPPWSKPKHLVEQGRAGPRAEDPFARSEDSVRA